VEEHLGWTAFRRRLRTSFDVRSAAANSQTAREITWEYEGPM
jgi:hypothetical protein